MIDRTLIYQWATYFEGNRGAAIAYRDEIQRNGRPRDPDCQAKQLGLSIALTPFEHRCEHYGDSRYCPFCL